MSFNNEILNTDYLDNPSLIVLSEKPQFSEEIVALSERGIEALAIWKARPGEILSVMAPDGSLFRARLLGEKDKIKEVLCFEELGPIEERPYLVLCQALPEKQRFNLILEKVCELGVDAIIPFTSRYSTNLEILDSRQRRSHRWPDILLRASRQCRRAFIPELFPLCSFDFLLSLIRKDFLSLVLYEREEERFFMDSLKSCKKEGVILLFTGPEGGWSKKEIEELKEKGAISISLGREILRTETAAILSVGLVRYSAFF